MVERWGWDRRQQSTGCSAPPGRTIDALFVLSPVVESTISEPQGDAKGDHAK
jgi:hypothetical protein